MFQKIYEKGYFYEWNEKNQLLFSSRFSVDRNKLADIIDDCIKWGIFDGDLYEKYKILASERIQKHYTAVVYKRINVEMIEDYLLIDVHDRSNITLTRVSDDGNPNATEVSDVQGTQSKVNKIKVNESKVYKNKTYDIISETYNNQNIIIHRELTDKIRKVVDKALRSNEKDIILEAIERYGQAFRDKEYRFCTYKMTLDRFLTQDNGIWIGWMRVKNGLIIWILRMEPGISREGTKN